MEDSFNVKDLRKSLVAIEDPNISEPNPHMPNSRSLAASSIVQFKVGPGLPMLRHNLKNTLY